MGCDIGGYLLALVEELDVVERKNVGAESGGLGGYHEAYLHIASEAFAEFLSVGSLDTHKALVGYQRHAGCAIGEVVERGGEYGRAALHAIKYLQQAAAKLIA